MSDGASWRHGGANISLCGKYRYSLDRYWDSRDKVLFVMLNPSTADGSEDDATIRRCIGFAKSWGYGGLYVVNLFAFRATKIKDLKAADDPVGPENEQYIKRACGLTSEVICAWGVHGGFKGQDRAVMNWLKEAGTVHPRALKITKSGYPGHPLYLPKTSARVPFPGDRQ